MTSGPICPTCAGAGGWATTEGHATPCPDCRGNGVVDDPLDVPPWMTPRDEEE